MENGQMLEMIFDEVKENRKALTRIDDKMDRKMDILHSRITQESKDRGELGKEVGCVQGKLRGIVSRINWLYVLLSAVGASSIGALLIVLLKGETQ